LFVLPYFYGFGDLGYGYQSSAYYDYGVPYSYWGASPYGSVYGGSAVYLDAAPAYPAVEQFAEAEQQSPADEFESEAGMQYLASARDAFRRADYREAARMAGHAAVEMPRNAEVHQFSSLVLFAVAEYRGSATAAHVALSLGTFWDWPTLSRQYSQPVNYTPQLRALEKYVRENPTAAYAPFLLGYHYLMLGHRKAAERNLAKAVELSPDDKLAARLLKALQQKKRVSQPPIPPSPNSETPNRTETDEKGAAENKSASLDNEPSGEK
jgi:tetratricopeptide (TPR) repeat protein